LELCEGNMEGGLLYWSLKHMLKEALTTVICLHRDPVERTWRGSFTWNCERQAKRALETESLSMGPGERAPLLGTLRHVKKKTLENNRIQLAC
jgi:hypothetical protein